MTGFNRKEWLENDCVYTHNCGCDACPYVVYDDFGSRKCEKELYEECMELYCEED